MSRDSARRRGVVAFALAVVVPACGWDFGRIFDRDDPDVEQARAALRASYATSSASVSAGATSASADLAPARALLEEVVRFHCDVVGDSNADAGPLDRTVERPGGSLDLGLVLFRIAELFGPRFGDEERAAHNGGATDGEPSKEQQRTTLLRARELECVRLLLERVGADPSVSASMRLRAQYLLGNFAFLTRKYSDAIDAYDRVLLAHPAQGEEATSGEVGAPTDDDAVARDAAWNRAIALRRLEDQKDAGADAPDAGEDGGDGAADSPDASDSGDSGDAGDTGDSGDGGDSGDSGDGGSDGAGDGSDGGDGGDGGDAGSSANSKPDASPATSASSAAPTSSASAAPSSSASSGYDLRELDRFEQRAPIDPDQPMRTHEKRRPSKAMDK